MPEYATELLRRDSIAEGTMAFHFRKPDGFEFRAGQALDLTLLDPPETDAEGNTRAFSIASSPHEETLMVATPYARYGLQAGVKRHAAGLGSQDRRAVRRPDPP